MILNVFWGISPNRLEGKSKSSMISGKSGLLASGDGQPGLEQLESALKTSNQETKAADGGSAFAWSCH